MDKWVQFKVEMVLLMKPREALTDSSLAKEAFWTSLKVMLLAQIKLSKDTAVSSALEANCKAPDTDSKEDLKEFKYLLLLMFRTLTSFKEPKPSTDSREVSETTMLLADCKLVLKVEMAGRVIKLMVSTSSSAPKDAVVKMVKSCMFKAPVISLTESAAKEPKEVAL